MQVQGVNIKPSPNCSTKRNRKKQVYNVINPKLYFQQILQKNNQVLPGQSIWKSIDLLEKYINSYRPPSKYGASTRKITPTGRQTDRSINLKQQFNTIETNCCNKAVSLSYTSPKPSKIQNTLNATSILTQNFQTNAVYVGKRSLSAVEHSRNKQKLSSSYNIQSHLLSRSMQKEISLMNSLLEPCSIRKKIILSRDDAPLNSPVVHTQRDKQLNRSRRVYSQQDRNRILACKRNIQLIVNKQKLSAWQEYKSEQPDML